MNETAVFEQNPSEDVQISFSVCFAFLSYFDRNPSNLLNFVF